MPNSHLGSLVAEVIVVGLSKKQRKRMRRRDSRLGLRNVGEERVILKNASIFIVEIN